MQKMLALKIGTLAFGVANLAFYAAAASVPGQSQSLPAATAVPVSFVHAVDARKAKAGDRGGGVIF